MRLAYETRKEAREALKENRYWTFWGGNLVLNFAMGFFCVAVMLASVVLVAVGLGISITSVLCLPLDTTLASALVERYGETTGACLLMLALLLVFQVALFPLLYAMGFMQWGLARMSLSTIERNISFDQCFSGWGHGWHMGWIVVVSQTYLCLWMLLVIPGIVKIFSYAMTPFIAVEHPDWSANACITESRRIMAGNRWRYFCLNFSFFGWYLLATLAGYVAGPLATCFLVPYVETAKAAFYDEIKRR